MPEVYDKIMIPLLLAWAGLSGFCLRDLWRAVNLSRAQKIVYSVLVPGTGMIGILLFFTFRRFLSLPPKRGKNGASRGLAAIGAKECPPADFGTAVRLVGALSVSFRNGKAEAGGAEAGRTMERIGALLNGQERRFLRFQTYERGFYLGRTDEKGERSGTGIYVWNFDASNPFGRYEALAGEWEKGLPSGTAVFFSRTGPADRWFCECRDYREPGQYGFRNGKYARMREEKRAGNFR